MNAWQFDVRPQTRIVFGTGKLEWLGRLTAELGCRHVLLVTDEGLVRAGHVARAQRTLGEAGVAITVYEEVAENPTTADVNQCLAVAQRAEVDGLIALGGGSSLDTAKGCNFLLTNGGTMHDYWGYGKATRPMLPLIAVPTTGGTGSECQSYALIADEISHRKMACGDPKAAPRVALLDPELTLTQPFKVTRDTGLDALVHAVECSVTKDRTSYSLTFAHRAFHLINAHFCMVLDQPENLEARAAMQLAAAFAGMAIENSMLGSAHAAANPLTAHYGMVHGQAVGLMLPWVVRFNLTDVGACSAYAELARSAGLVGPNSTDTDSGQVLLDRLDDLLAISAIPTQLGAHGLVETDIDTLAGSAAEQWTARFNPRQMMAEDFANLYRRAI